MEQALVSGKGQSSTGYGEKGMRLVRTWETLLLLTEASQALTAPELHHQLHRKYPFSETPCSVQTIREDLRTLKKCGFPVCALDRDGVEIDLEAAVSQHGKNKDLRWTLRDPACIPNLNSAHQRQPSSADLIAISLCRALLQQQVPSAYPLYKSVGRLLDELMLQLNRHLRHEKSQLGQIHERVRVLGRQYLGETVAGEMLQKFTEAIGRSQVLLADYCNRDGGTREVDVAPLAVWFAEGRAYVLAAGATDRKMRAWRVDRFTNVRVALGRRQPDISDQEIEENLRQSFRGYISDPVHLRLSVKPQAAYLFREFQYHPTQQITEQPDGSLEVEMDCASGWPLEEWILGFGELVQVLEPENIAQTIAFRARRVVELYGNSHVQDGEHDH